MTTAPTGTDEHDLNKERETAEREYTMRSFHYLDAPIGSRDWSLFWDGWLGRASLGAAPDHDLLVERLKLEAQTHAQEARTANATIAEIYQVVTGSTGEPGNWNGAEPVRKCIEDLRASLGAAQVPTVNRETVIEWLDANDIEVTDRQLNGLFSDAAAQVPSLIGSHDAHPAPVPMPTGFAWPTDIAALSQPSQQGTK